MRWLPLLLLTACTPEMLAADDPIAASWLEDGAEADIAERAYLGTYGEARLTADGEPFEGTPWDDAFYTPGRSLAQAIIENEMLNGEAIRLDGSLRMQSK